MDERAFSEALATIGQKKLKTATVASYEIVDKLWFKHWQKFLSQYEKESWPIVRQFVVDSLIAEIEQSAAPGETK